MYMKLGLSGLRILLQNHEHVGSSKNSNRNKWILQAPQREIKLYNKSYTVHKLIIR
jgi:hypothetical protein